MALHEPGAGDLRAVRKGLRHVDGALLVIRGTVFHRAYAGRHDEQARADLALERGGFEPGGNHAVTTSLEGAARVEARHLLEAVQYRALDRPAATEAR